jgi:polyferredoxin
MFAQLPERQMHWVRWVLTIGWLLVIASLFYDPWTATLTEPAHPWSPFRLTGECVQVQGTCIEEQPHPLGATIFWGAIVPSGIFILLVFGHELWRRICPLSFLSQIPRALGRQRQFKRENQKTGKIRYELAKVKPDSWLGRNYPYLQFGYLFVGLCGRILFFNADRLVLGLWLVLTIGAAIAVGYFYGGKSWCQYFCPMAPVQTIFSEPSGLLGSKAHMSEQRITQSMCRTVEADGSEQSACVACQSPCFDIDSERTYWDGLNKPDEKLIRYGYVGLVIGYFVYYYLYAGNWDYYFSGVWNRDPNQLSALMNPGLYLFGQAINIPKLVAVPLVLGGFTAIGYFGGKLIEKYLKSLLRQRANLSADVIQHRIFAVCTFGIFNFFFFFAGRPLIQLLPLWVQYGFDVSLVFLSTLWLQKAWRRHPDLYSRENLASRFRKQLDKMQPELSQFLDGRMVSDLNANEIYVLAKVLPSFTREKRHEVYKGVVREALEEGYVNYSSSLEVLKQMRQELGMSDDEHREVLDELGIEDPTLLDPNRQRTLENQIRLNGYQKSLERLMRLRQRQPDLETFEPSRQDSAEIRFLRSEYSITPQEEDWILRGFSPDATNVQNAEFLLTQLSDWVDCDRALHQPLPQAHAAIVTLLREGVAQKQELLARAILSSLSTLSEPNATAIARSLQQLTPAQVQVPKQRADWQNSLHPEIEPVAPTAAGSKPADLSSLDKLLQHQNPLMRAAALYLIAQLDWQRAQTIARQLQAESEVPLVRETAAQLLAASALPPLTALPTLEKLVYLATSDFFRRMQPETLLALADRATVKTYSANAVITEAGDTCRELLLLIEGDAKVHYQRPDGVQVDYLHPGQILDELEVLGHSKLENTILAENIKTRILAIPVDAFDDLLDHDPDFARRVLELESRHLQQLMQPVA